jgi:hypothetical protein
MLRALTLVCSLSIALPARAEGDAALAQSLFDEGQRLMEEGKIEQACPKFAGSNQADPSVGALLNLARCHEQTGRPASAWAEYSAAASLARRLGQAQRAEGASERAANLEPTLSKLTIVVTEPYPGLTIKRDGEPVPGSAHGLPVAVDPGQRWIEAEAPGYEPWKGSVVVGTDADRAEIVVPPLTKLPAPPQHGPEGLATLDIAAIATGSVGLACIAVGSALGAVALSQRSDLSDRCGSDNVCAPPIDVASETSSIGSLGHASTAMFVVGGVSIGAAAAMVILSAFDEPGADGEPEVQASLGAGGVFVGWSRSF